MEKQKSQTEIKMNFHEATPSAPASQPPLPIPPPFQPLPPPRDSRTNPLLPPPPPQPTRYEDGKDEDLYDDPLPLNE